MIFESLFKEWTCRLMVAIAAVMEIKKLVGYSRRVLAFMNLNNLIG